LAAALLSTSWSLWGDILNILIRVNASASAAHSPIQLQEMPVATADVPDHAVDQRWSEVCRDAGEGKLLTAESFSPRPAVWQA
jgi:hypothetical protein